MSGQPWEGETPSILFASDRRGYDPGDLGYLQAALIEF